ncbi:MAG: 4a-hydroxytetrahydrobiopterin dehydratase [Patescibacteria group bacterium]
MSNDFLSKKCAPCEGGIAPMAEDKAHAYVAEVLGWQLNKDAKQISKHYEFKDFKEAMIFINKIANLAESEGHHPDIAISYNKVDLVLSTHAIGGLSENDFILAAKINQL